MAYTPPSGNAIALNFSGAYSPPAGGSLTLNFGVDAEYLPVQSGMNAGTRIPWNDAPKKERHLTSRYRDSALLPRHIRALFDRPVMKDRQGRYPWNSTPSHDLHNRIPWGDLPEADHDMRAPWGQVFATDRQARASWDPLAWIDALWGSPWASPPALDCQTRVGYDDTILPADRGITAGWNDPRIVDEHTMTQWGDQVYQTICYPDYQPDPALNFEKLLANTTSELYFTRHSGDPRCTTRQPGGWRDAYPSFVIPPSAGTNPIQRTYIVINTHSFLKLPERVAVAVSDVQLSLDIDSWAWTLSAKVIGQTSIDLIKPSASGAVEVEVTINGYIWIFVVEKYSRDKRFNNSTYTVTGRSKTAYLSDPYKLKTSYVEGNTRTAQQLADQEVSGDGWTVVWNSVAWTVPPGAYYYTDKTPMQAVVMIAGSVGGVILPDRSLDQITVNPRYQDSVWNWAGATPSASLTLDVAKKIGSTFNPKPSVNGVHVSGEAQGVTCFVRRTGTDGANLAQEVVDTLITHQDAGRERGRNVICDQGYQEVVTLELPLMPSGTQPELFEPGELLEINEGGGDVWRGLVLGSSISASDIMSGLRVSQTVSLERHLS